MKTRQKLNIGIWVLVIITLFLLATTTAVLAMRLGGYLPENMDVIFLKPREPGVWVEDADGKEWAQTETVEIFSMEHVGETGNVVVKSHTNDGIIAPGVETSYKFYLKNTGNFALDFIIELNPKLMLHSTLQTLDALPFEVRVHNQNGNYLIGNETEWVKISDAPSVVDTGIVGKNSYYSYVLEWRWVYESGNDEYDTYLGGLSYNDPVVMQVDLSMTAEESTNLSAQGGMPLEQGNGTVSQDAGTIRVWPMIVLIILLLASAAGLVLLILRRRKTDRSENQ